jgi:hypothetical protein
VRVRVWVRVWVLPGAGLMPGGWVLGGLSLHVAVVMLRVACSVTAALQGHTVQGTQGNPLSHLHNHSFRHGGLAALGRMRAADVG